MFFPLPTTISHLFLKTLLPFSHTSNNPNVIPFNPPFTTTFYMITTSLLSSPLIPRFLPSPSPLLIFSSFHAFICFIIIIITQLKPNEYHFQLLHIIHDLLIQVPCCQQTPMNFKLESMKYMHALKRLQFANFLLHL